MNAPPPRVRRSSAGVLAGAPDALVELARRDFGLRAEVAVEHRLERLVVTDGERVIAGLVVRAHEEAMRLLVVRLQLQQLLERPDGGLRILPLELECRELLRRRDELTVRLFTLPIDPRRRQISEKFTAMHRHRGAEVLDRLTRSSGFLRLATAAQRTPEYLEVHVDRDRKRQSISRVGPHDARGLRGAGRGERLTKGVQREVKVGERRRRIRLRPKVSDELVSRDRALPVEQQQSEKLLRLVRAPSAVADPRAARAELEWTENERLNAVGDRRGDRVRRCWCGRLQERREDAHVVGVELEIAKPLAQSVGDSRTQQQEVPIAFRSYGTKRPSCRRGVVLDQHR